MVYFLILIVVVILGVVVAKGLISSRTILEESYNEFKNKSNKEILQILKEYDGEYILDLVKSELRYRGLEVFKDMIQYKNDYYILRIHDSDRTCVSVKEIYEYVRECESLKYYGVLVTLGRCKQKIYDIANDNHMVIIDGYKLASLLRGEKVFLKQFKLV